VKSAGNQPNPAMDERNSCARMAQPNDQIISGSGDDKIDAGKDADTCVSALHVAPPSSACS